MNSKLPVSVGIILDGNRRWAKAKGLPSLEGHRAGAERLADVAQWVRDRGIKHLVVYAFSTENWNRTSEEVSYLMELFRTTVEQHLTRLAGEHVRICFVGQRERFSSEIQEMMRHVEETSAHNTGLTLWICFSYGGRADIVQAARKAGEQGNITEETLTQYLWTAGMPDPDIIIRTGGEKRLSGFLTWQSVYSELFFRDEYWPDFSEKILDEILDAFMNRDRRMGR
ncbi:MAG: polyprenyl diphosphate synthase [Patescibacteria group bacterium]